MSALLEKNVGFLRRKGTSERKVVTDQRDGSVAGVETERWDDSQEAVAFMKPLKLRAHRMTREQFEAGHLNVGDGRGGAGLLIPGHGLLVRPYFEGPKLKELEQLRELGIPLPISGGAFTVGGLYLLNWIDVLDATQLAIDLSLTTHRIALYTNTLSPNFSSDSAYSATNEITGTGYTAGGATIGSPTVTESPTGSLMYDMADQVWSGASFTARGMIEYADALAGNNLIVAAPFGADITATAAPFTIAWASTGVFALDLTP